VGGLGNIPARFPQVQNCPCTPGKALVSTVADYSFQSSSHRASNLGYTVFHWVASSAFSFSLVYRSDRRVPPEFPTLIDISAQLFRELYLTVVAPAERRGIIVKILQVKALEIPEIQVVRFARFCDERGYFTETFRKSDLNNLPDSEIFHGVEFVQGNESRSREGTIRGLHFQWNPYMGKLIRTLSGRMIDLVLDIRKRSPTFGRIIAYDMPSNSDQDYGEWIWVPPGFAHGNLFTSESTIEYLCSGEYSPEHEAGISPFAEDIDWSL
jgi:dTDP-4-dehydrorhamnose 3,5-epimerase